MTFNQWCSRYNFSTHSKISVEAIWNALIEGGKTPAQCAKLLNDLFYDLWKR
jgi:hypothetical protein